MTHQDVNREPFPAPPRLVLLPVIRLPVIRLPVIGLTLVGLALLAAAGCSDPYDESGPADQLSFGTLCAPSTADCPSSALLSRSSAVGANRLDFRLENQGEAASITVEAAYPEDAAVDAGPSDASTADAQSADADTGQTSSDPTVLIARTYVLRAGEQVEDRFVQEELFSLASFRLSVRCDGCTATLDYSLASEPLECRSDDDCSGSWVCSQSDGRCVECLSNADCADNQSCATDTRTCTPPASSGCSHAPGNPPVSPAWPLVALGAVFAAGAFWRRRRRATGPLIAAMLVAGIFAARPSPARADPPRASFNLGAGSRFLTGNLGDHTKRGIGLSVSQEVRGTYVGGRVELGASYFLTTQPAPPLSRELQMYSVSLGPQFYLPAGPVAVVIGLDYRHVGLVSNSLVRLTGPQVNHGAAGGTVEVRYALSPLEFMIRGGYHPIFGLDSSLFSIDLAVGLATE